MARLSSKSSGAITLESRVAISAGFASHSNGINKKCKACIMDNSSTYLSRIADALERLAPLQPGPVSIHVADAFIWHAENMRLDPVNKVQTPQLSMLKGIDHVRDILLRNSEQFAAGFPANNALLWGARGMGKSSLVKAIHRHINAQKPRALALVEIHREDIPTLPRLMELLARDTSRRIILFCDDLSFDGDDSSYKSLKTALEGGLAGRPEHILFYATSNRRHLMPRDMIENERSTAIHPGEAIEEKVSLSDRFGLWLGFHSCSQDIYLEMIAGYIEAYKLKPAADWRPEAIEWAATRGARSGRVAWHFIQDLAGRMEMILK